MNEEETLARYAEGREAWNEWADEMLARREALKEQGLWTDGTNANAWSNETAWWHNDAKADFSNQKLENINCENFDFPSQTEFNKTLVEGDALFSNATFSADAVFRDAKFDSAAAVSRATTGTSRPEADRRKTR